jgi:hypothetical protein
MGGFHLTALQIYALYIAPLVLLAAGVALYYVTGWMDKRERERERQHQ